MSYQVDTISAIATAPGEAGIAIVRVSGPDALLIADRLMVCCDPPPSLRPANSFVYGTIRGSENGSDQTVLDEVILLIYRAPNSYTREDVIEIQGHGGATSAARLLRATLDAGARSAEPGEFTRRAFLNGRIDLMQAEAVIDLIRARSDRAASAAIEQLSGSLSSSFNAIYDDLISVSGDLEATLDFGEAELPSATMTDIVQRLDDIDSSSRKILSSWEEGFLLREGALVVIAGSPNAGKSTLLNRLLETDRAIVTQVAGTTRDTIEETFVLGGIPLRLVDTAGLRETNDPVETQGIQRSEALLAQADIHLYLVDGSQALTPSDEARIKKLDPTTSVILVNKQDLGVCLETTSFAEYTIIHTSLAGNEDLSALKDAIQTTVGIASHAPAHAAISERHRDVLMTVNAHLKAAMTVLNAEGENGAAAASLDCRSALEELGTATGRIYHDELLTNVFSRFCLGK